jgi:acyltransferase
MGYHGARRASEPTADQTSSSSLAQHRSVAIDLVRVLGILAVVTGHYMGGETDPPNLVRLATFSWQVPIFFFLTGYLWTVGRAPGREVATRAKSLVVPYFAWMGLLGVIAISVVTASTGVFPWEQTLRTLWGGGLVRGAFAPYWFLPILFFVAVLLRVLEQAPRWVSWALAVGGLVVSYEAGSPLSHLPFDLFFTLPCMLFALLGQEFRRRRDKVPAPFITGCLLLVASAALLLGRLVEPLDMKLGEFGTPVASMIVSTAICIGLLLVAESALNGRRVPGSPLVTELALTSVVVLLTHTFAFLLLGPLSLPGPVVVVLSAALCWAGAFVIHRSPVSPALAGIPRRQRSALAGSGPAILSSTTDPRPLSGEAARQAETDAGSA